MHDGRNYSSWLPGGQLNEEIKKTYNITSNNDYRKYLTKNADSIIKYNQLLACDECCSNVNNITNHDVNNDNNKHNMKDYLGNALVGIKNLKETYATCSQTCARIDVIINKINHVLEDSKK